MSRQYFGNAGHLIVSDRCRFHLTTSVPGYLISTVGEFYPQGGEGPMETIGSGDDDNYETMVFPWRGDVCECGCGLPEPFDFCEIDCARYANAGAANAGHEALVVKYERETEDEA